MDKIIRKLKIYKKFRTRTWDIISVPEIRIEGKWLNELGFKEGADITILQEPNRLIITVNEENEKG